MKMRKTKAVHVILGLIGLAALALFVLGCTGSVAWNPDGSKIAFVYLDSSTRQRGVAVYDRRGKAVTSPTLAKDISLQTQWTKDGKNLFVLTCDGEHNNEILVYSGRELRPLRRISLPRCTEQLTVLPAPEFAGVVYLSLSNETLAKVNLSTGAVEATQVDNPGVLIPTATRTLYRRVVTKGREPAAPDQPKQNEEVQQPERALEFGIFDPATLGFEPRFELSIRDLTNRGFSDLGFWPAVEPSGRRTAMVVEGTPHDAIILLDDAGIERVLAPTLPFTQPYILGSSEWGRNGKMYVTVLVLRDEQTADAMVAQLAVDADAEPVITHIAQIDWSELGNDDEWRSNFRMMVRMALSPDGKTLAVNLADVEGNVIAPEARGLYLLDLKHPSRGATRVAPPVLREQPAPAASDTNE
jgi:hypothetical protein